MTKLPLRTILSLHLADLPRPSWKLGLLLAADLLDVLGSAAFAAMSPPPSLMPRGPSPLLDLPHVAPPITTGVAALGFTLAVLMTVEIVVEVSWLYRRTQLTFARRSPARPSRPSRASNEVLPLKGKLL
jgi:hypothetical protein